METNANVLVAQLNWLAIDLLGSLVTRWIAYIRLFDFEVCYVSRHKHIVVDRLSRRLYIESNNIDNAHKTDIEDFIDTKLGALSIVLIQLKEEEETTTSINNILEEGYSKDSKKITIYLTTLKRLEGIGRGKFQAFKK